MSNIKLVKCGSMIAHKVKNVDYLVCLTRILTVGEYTDMNGTPVKVTEETLIKLVDNYNNRIQKEFDKYIDLIKENSDELDASLVYEKTNITINDFDGLPNQINHDTSDIKSTVGNLIGKMYLKQSQGKLAIFVNIKVKGCENVECVSDNRWRYLSVQYNPITHEWVEVSWVIYGADPDATKIMSAVMAKNDNIPQTIKLQDNPIVIMNKCIETIKSLERKIFIQKNLIALCKLRKITKADSYYINKELESIHDIKALSSVFKILDEQISYRLPEKFIELPNDVMKGVHNILKSGANSGTYK